MSGGMADVTAVLTCVCRQPKYKSALNCVSKCPGVSAMGSLQGQFDKACQNPKAITDQLSGLMSTIGGMAGGAKGGKGGMGKAKGKGGFGKGKLGKAS